MTIREGVKKIPLRSGPHPPTPLKGKNKKQAGAELGQAHLKLGLEFT